jgi:hypothetical protein
MGNPFSRQSHDRSMKNIPDFAITFTGDDEKGTLRVTETTHAMTEEQRMFRINTIKISKSVPYFLNFQVEATNSDGVEYYYFGRVEMNNVSVYRQMIFDGVPTIFTETRSRLKIGNFNDIAGQRVQYSIRVMFNVETIRKIIGHVSKSLLIQSLDAIERGDYPRMPGAPEFVPQRLQTPPPTSSGNRPPAPPPPAAAARANSSRRINDESMGVLVMN